MSMISWDIIGMRDQMGRFGKVVESMQLDVVEESEGLMEEVQDIYRRFAPVGVSSEHFRDGIEADMLAVREGFEASITAPMPLREYLKHGTRPHMPPVDAITPWAEDHGIAPWALAMSIKKKGTRANDWEDKAQPFAEAIVREFGSKVGNRVITRLH